MPASNQYETSLLPLFPFLSGSVDRAQNLNNTLPNFKQGLRSYPTKLEGEIQHPHSIFIWKQNEYIYFMGQFEFIISCI